MVHHAGYLASAQLFESVPGDAARAGLADTAVLVLPPLGYEDTAAHRPLRTLARGLSRAGHRVVRLDWPGQGDSAGEALDDGLMEARLGAVRAVVEGLRGDGHGRVVGVGVRAGGLLAAAAIAAGTPLDGLVLWGVPRTGRRYLRELTAFHRMAARYFGEAPPEAAAHGLPEGAVEAGGFVVGPSCAAALREVDLRDLGRAAGLEGLLWIPREGAIRADALLGSWREAGLAVAESDAGGVGDLLEDAYHAALSPQVAAAIAGWLGAGPRTVPWGGPLGEARLVLPGGPVEEPWELRGDDGVLRGVICHPAHAGGGRDSGEWTLFFNAGGIRRCGPNRLWTRAARELARHGVSSLRLDVRDVGESDGAEEPFADLEAMYSEDSVRDALAAYDALVEAGARAVDVVGLCSGAFMGVQVAARREVRRATLFNGLAFVWDDHARAGSMTSHIRGSLLDARRWRRLLTGRIDARALARASARKVRLEAGDRLARVRGRAPGDPVVRVLREVVDRGTKLQLVSSAGDPSIAYLRGHLDRDPGGWAGPPLKILQGLDHTIRPVWGHHLAIGAILGRHLDDLERGPAPTPE